MTRVGVRCVVDIILPEPGQKEKCKEDKNHFRIKNKIKERKENKKKIK